MCAERCERLVRVGDTVTLEASAPGTFAYFAGFLQDECSAQGNPCTLVADRDRVMDAQFTFY
jgi:hypothetical protein